MATSSVKKVFHDSGTQTLVDGVTYRKIGNVVQLTVVNKGISGNVQIGTLPSGYFPTMDVRTPNQDCKGNLVVSATGAVYLQKNEGVSGSVYFVGTTAVFPTV